MNITTIGLDLAKSVSHVVCCNQAGKIVRKKMLRRKEKCRTKKKQRFGYKTNDSDRGTSPGTHK